MSMINDAMSASMPGTAKQFFAGVQAKPVSQMAIYVAILSLFGVVGTIVGLTMFGAYGFVFPMEYVILSAVLSLVTSVVALIGASILFAAISQQFVGRQVSADEIATIAGYAMTPALVAGIQAIVPALGMIGMLIGGLYSLYLLYIACAAKFGADKAIVGLVGYFVSALVIGFVMSIITGIILLSVYNPYAGLSAAYYY